MVGVDAIADLPRNLHVDEAFGHVRPVPTARHRAQALFGRDAEMNAATLMRRVNDDGQAQAWSPTNIALAFGLSKSVELACVASGLAVVVIDAP